MLSLEDGSAISSFTLAKPEWAWLERVVIDSTGEVALFSIGDHTGSLIRLDDGLELFRFRPPGWEPPEDYRQYSRAVALSPDGTLAAVGFGRTALVWDTRSGEQIATFTPPKALPAADPILRFPSSAKGRIRQLTHGVAFRTGTRRAEEMEERFARRFNLPSTRLAEEGELCHLTFSGCSRYLLSAATGRYGPATGWDLWSLTTKEHLEDSSQRYQGVAAQSPFLELPGGPYSMKYDARSYTVFMPYIIHSRKILVDGRMGGVCYQVVISSLEPPFPELFRFASGPEDEYILAAGVLDQEAIVYTDHDKIYRSAF